MINGLKHLFLKSPFPKEGIIIIFMFPCKPKAHVDPYPKSGEAIFSQIATGFALATTLQVGSPRTLQMLAVTVIS
jgi:hypothetical protein